MVTFSCDLCADAVKKPKASQHMMRCRATMTCVDCGKVFDASTVNSHNSCVSEAEKYQGKLYAGPKHSDAGGASASSASAAAVDLSLIRGPPWVCKMCSVTCSGRDNLISHHQSKKHVNKAKHLASASSAGSVSAPVNAPSTSLVVKAADEQPQADGSPILKCKTEKAEKQKKSKKEKKEKKDKKQKKDKKDKKDKTKAKELQGISKAKL